MPPTVSLICGFIGAGKTTFAKALAAQTGAFRITKDEWSIRLIGNDPTIDGYTEHDHRIIDLSRHVAFQLAANGTDVILDEGFWSREDRDAMRWQFEARGAIARIYYLDTPMDTIRERVAARNTAPSPDSFRIDRDVLESYLPFWHPPGDDEDVIRIVDQG